MDTLFGLIGSFGLMLAAILLSGPLGTFIDMQSALIVLGGSIMSLFVAFPAARVKDSVRVAKRAFTSQPRKAVEMLSTIQEMAGLARREGVLALEQKVAEQNDDFIKKGIELVVDGHEPSAIEDVLFTEIDRIEQRHKLGADIFETMGLISPAFGMIGTLIGLVRMLQNLSDPSAIGPAMAVALLTTFYGAVLANVVAVPVAKKLRVRSAQEVEEKTLVANGLLAIVNGESPRFVVGRLNAQLPPAERLKEAS